MESHVEELHSLCIPIVCGGHVCQSLVGGVGNPGTAEGVETKWRLAVVVERVVNPIEPNFAPLYRHPKLP